MTKEEALELQVGKDKIFVVEPKMEEIFELDVVRVELTSYKNLKSPVQITGHCKALSGRVYNTEEVCGTQLEALERLANIHQLRADQALNKKHHVVSKIAKLKRRKE